MQYTDEQKYHNYLMLMHAKRATREEMNEQWMEMHAKNILMIRAHFEDMNCIIVPDDRDDLKENRRRTEILLQNLEQSINATGKFDVIVYRLFVENLEPIIRLVIPEEDLDHMFENMNLDS